MPVEVLTVATQITWSRPGCTDITRPNLHLRGGRLSSLMSTSASSFNCSPAFFHLRRCCNSETYSLLHLFQKCCCRFWTNCYLDSLDSGKCVKSGSSTAFKVFPTRKWAGVRGIRSLGSVDIGINLILLRSELTRYQTLRMLTLNCPLPASNEI